MYFIVHLNQIYNSYSQTKEEKKTKNKKPRNTSPNKTSCLILQYRHFEYNFVLRGKPG